MDEYIKVIDYKSPMEFLGETVNIEVAYEEDPIWFKVTAYGKEGELTYLKGFDIERMNRRIFIKDINHIYVFK